MLLQILRSFTVGIGDSRALDVEAHGLAGVYIGAAAPEGMKPNFMRTIGDDGWFVYFPELKTGC